MTLGRLTPRQREVYDLYQAGLSHREIADRLYIEPTTAKGHLYDARKRLGVQAVRRRYKPVPPPLSILPPYQRRVCALARTGLTDDEVAERLGITPGVVRTALSDARRRYAEQREAAA